MAAALPGLTQALGLIRHVDAADYKAKTNSASAMRRSTLHEILRVVQAQDSALSERVEANLHFVVLKTPEKHVGEPEWLQLTLPEGLAESVLDCLGSAEASAVGLDGETTWQASRVADLVDAWQRWCQRDET